MPDQYGNETEEERRRKLAAKTAWREPGPEGAVRELYPKANITRLSPGQFAVGAGSLVGNNINEKNKFVITSQLAQQQQADPSGPMTGVGVSRSNPWQVELPRAGAPQRGAEIQGAQQMAATPMEPKLTPMAPNIRSVAERQGIAGREAKRQQDWQAEGARVQSIDAINASGKNPTLLDARGFDTGQENPAFYAKNPEKKLMDVPIGKDKDGKDVTVKLPVGLATTMIRFNQQSADQKTRDIATGAVPLIPDPTDSTKMIVNPALTAKVTAQLQSQIDLARQKGEIVFGPDGKTLDPTFLQKQQREIEKEFRTANRQKAEQLTKRWWDLENMNQAQRFKGSGEILPTTTADIVDAAKKEAEAANAALPNTEQKGQAETETAESIRSQIKELDKQIDAAENILLDPLQTPEEKKQAQAYKEEKEAEMDILEKRAKRKERINQ